jgi:hypothetical protein
VVAAVGLTDAKIKGLKAPESGQVEYPDVLVPGLRLRVGSSGAKTFILRKRVGGRSRNLTLDRYHERRFTLADARKKARALISDIEAGAEPQARGRGRKVGSTAGTVKALFDEYKKAKAGLRSISEIERIFDKYVIPELGGRLADSITRADITRLIDGITMHDLRRTGATGLQRLGVRLEVTESVLNHVSGSRGGIVGVHPFRIVLRISEELSHLLLGRIDLDCDDVLHECGPPIRVES